MDRQGHGWSCLPINQSQDNTARATSAAPAYSAHGACRCRAAVRHTLVVALLLVLVACLVGPAGATSRMLQAEPCTAAKTAECRRLGQVCVQNKCTPTSCTNHLDCTSTRAPYCIQKKCKSTCARDSQCKGLKVTANFCVAGVCKADMCGRDSHCSKRFADGARPFCVKQASGNSICRECNNDAACLDNPRGNACNAATGKCVECTGQSHCAALATLGSLTQALGTAATPDRVICDAATLKCKLDTSSSPVDPPANSSQVVNPPANSSQAVIPPAITTSCSSNEDCPKKGSWGPQQVCSTSGPTAGTCVECAADTDCPAGLNGAKGTCSAEGRCVECSTNGASGECPKPGPLSVGGICAAGINKCVECAADNDCRYAWHATTSMRCWLGKCVSCGEDSHCTKYVGVEGLGPYCIDEQCQVKGKACTADGDCSYNANCFWLPDGKCPEAKCDTATNTCDSFITGL